MRLFYFLTVLCLLGIADSTSVAAQEGRYELGRRLRRYELTWDRVADADRVRSTPVMEKAVGSFFSLRWLDAAQALDQALHSLESNQEPSVFKSWVLAQRLVAQPALSDMSTSTVTVRCSSFYPVEAKTLDFGQAELTLLPLKSSEKTTSPFAPADEPVAKTDWFPTSRLQDGFTWTLPQVPEGDYWLIATIRGSGGEESLELGRMMLSRVERLEARLETVASKQLASAPEASETGTATLRQTLSLLQDIQDGIQQEIDYPATHLLRTCELLVAANGNSEAVFSDAFSGETWLTLAQDKRSTAMRVRVPAGQTRGTARPVLFLFHGAGGSENMFFETYGAGRAVDLAAERGWIVVATRQGLLGGIGLGCADLVELLDRHFSIDRERIFLMGHSMGAGQAIQQATRAPQLPAAVIALGGGSGVNGSRIGDAPWFVAAGDLDFGRRGAKALADSLTAAGKQVRWEIYSNTEHMVIVQAALNDAFEFLDQVAARRPTATP